MEHEVKQKVKEILKASNQKRKLEMELTKQFFQLCKKELIGKKICLVPRNKYDAYHFFFIKDVKKSSWGYDNHIAFKGPAYGVTQDGCLDCWNESGKSLNHVCIYGMKGIVVISDEQWETVVQFASIYNEKCNELKEFLKTLNR